MPAQFAAPSWRPPSECEPGVRDGFPAQWQKKHKCGRCSNEFTYYKLCESRRANTVTERDGEPRDWRVCMDCELDLRLDEWAS